MKRPVQAVPHTAALLLALFAIPADGVAATSYPGFIPMVTDSAAVFTVPNVTRPLYDLAMLDPTFGTVLTRVTDDAGKPIGPLGSAWGTVSRQVYSKVQPWNSTMTRLTIDNSGNGLDPVYLDGNSYQPVHGPCPSYDRWDARWHPKLVHSREEINVNRTGTELMWFDVENCVKTRSWPLPIVSDYGIGSGEGNVSNSGRYVAIANAHQMVVIDMDPPSSVAPPYPYLRIGPVYTFAACSLDVARPDSGFIGNVSISPSGRYIDVKYGALALAGMPTCDTLCDMHRIFDVDSALVIRPHNMDDASLRCGSFQSRPNGWVFPLKHADMTYDPDDDNEDVLIGGRACPGSNLGHVVKVRLRDGLVTSLTNPNNEPSYSHGSARNLVRPGWFYVTYSRDPVYQGFRFFGEVVAVRIDGSGQVQRFGHYHSTAATFDSEAHGVPSPDGRRVMFASDWADHALGTPQPGVRAYVLDARDGATLDTPGPSPPRRLELVSLSPNPTPHGLHVRFRIPSPRPAALELYDLAGRRLYVADAGTLGVGEHVLDLDPEGQLEPGIYFVTLTDGHDRLTARAAVIR